MSRDKIKVLQFTTFNEDCGIGKYQENIVKAFDTNKVESDFYHLSPNLIKHFDKKRLRRELYFMTSKASEYDVIHVQHEFGFFKDSGTGFLDIMKALKKSGKPIVVTIHTAPELIYKKNQLAGKTLRNIVGYTKRELHNKKIMKYRLSPFLLADTIITFNKFTQDQLIGLVGVGKDKIYKTLLPVNKNNIAPSSGFRKEFGFKNGDIVLCTVGFIHEFKGVDHAIKALKLLPSNYKLAILGGINPDSGNPATIDALYDLIVSLHLQDRVKITGYIKDDKTLDSYIKACDIALYPYSPIYYKLASSDAINRSLGNSIPIVAYPAQSFLEINDCVKDALCITHEPSFHELAKMVATINLSKRNSAAEKYVKMNSYHNLANIHTDIYYKLTHNSMR